MYSWTIHCVKLDTGEIIDHETRAPDEQTAEAIGLHLYPRPDYIHHWITSRDPELLRLKSQGMERVF